MVVCRFFLQGRCMKGDSCRFSHDAERTNASALRAIVTPLRVQDGLSPAAATLEAVVPVRGALTREIMGQAIDVTVSTGITTVSCRFYQRGSCRNGAACTFVHDDSTPAKVEAILDEDDREIDSYKRDLGGALVQYENGAIVSKVSLPDDFSAVRMTGLPADSTAHSVVELLSKLDQAIDPGCVRIVKERDLRAAAADVLVEDPKFADAISGPASLNKIDATGTLDVKKVTPTLSGSSNFKRVERRKVQCSWFKPAKRAWLNYSQQSIAQEVYEKFESKSYTLRGKSCACSKPQRSGSAMRAIWTIMLMDLPVDISRGQIMASIKSKAHKPYDISVGGATYEADGEEACATVLSLLSNFGNIEWSQANTELEGKRAKAVARFCQESDAVLAERHLHGQKLPFAPNLKLDVQVLSTAKFKVRSDIFKIVQPRIRAASAGWTGKGSSFKAYPPSDPMNQYRMIKIEGPTTEVVAVSKHELDTILDGETLRDGHEKPLWNPALQLKGRLFERIRTIEKEHKVIVMCDRRHRRIRVIGPEQNVARAKVALSAELSKASSTDTTITLDPSAFRWACRGGFRWMQRSLGPNIAAFDISTKTIAIRGSDQDFEKALRIVQKQSLIPADETDAGHEDTCPACFTPAEQPVKFTCGDEYCTECFELMSSAAGTGDDAFPILCHGKEGQCQHIFTLPELQDNLSSTAFEDLLEASFTSHIKRHPEAFAYCSKPDCDAIYKKNSKNDMHTCSKCFTITCTKCHAQHDRESCVEYYDRTSGAAEAAARLKKELGIQDCPKCKTSIEKTEGCNHMTCGGCGTHICWKCLEHFATSALCYAHLNEKHAGVYDGGLYAPF